MWYIIVCILITINRLLKGKNKIKIIKYYLKSITNPKNIWSKKTNQLFIVYRIYAEIKQ